jgi:toxin CptA
MSIAVTAVVKPSRLLRASLAAYAAVNLVVAGLVLAAAPGAYRAPWLVAACCLAAAAGAMAGLVSAGNKRRIDISGVGEMRVTVQQKLAETVVHTVPSRLMPGSAVWPGLLMLLARADDRRMVVVAVFADSVSAEEFRALAVAMRAIGGQETQDQVFFGPHKIL